jgi:hypothetical protein
MKIYPHLCSPAGNCSFLAIDRGRIEAWRAKRATLTIYALEKSVGWNERSGKLLKLTRAR